MTSVQKPMKHPGLPVVAGIVVRLGSVLTMAAAVFASGAWAAPSMPFRVGLTIHNTCQIERGAMLSSHGVQSGMSSPNGESPSLLACSFPQPYRISRGAHATLPHPATPPAVSGFTPGGDASVPAWVLEF